MEEKLLERVRKMLRLANDAAASEGERDNALRMVQNILAKYNMSMAQVDMHAGASANGSTASEKREHNAFTVKNKAWMLWCAHAIAQLMFCEMFRSRGADGTVHVTFIGRSSNIITAQEMTQFVIDSIRREGRHYSKGVAREHLAFNEGAATRLQERCRQLRADADKIQDMPQSTGTSLVLSSVYDSEQAANKRYIAQTLGVVLRKGTPGRTSGGSGEARAAGRAYGDRVSLHRQVR